ncbi:MAG: transglutaminase-like cysteine peptidase [Gemmatimonas sp.]|jgi:predicted transglutaminase-like cysteine proteinase
MGILNYQRVGRAAVLACALAYLGTAIRLEAAPLDSHAAIKLSASSGEPFGLAASAMTPGALQDKWKALTRKLDDERVQLALCDGDREHCASDAALRFLAIVDQGREREGRARLGEINRAINLAIHPMSDLAQYGQMDVWSSPLATFYRGAGDCEDYAIAKFVALRQAGVPGKDLRIVIMRDVFHGEDHAVAAARLDGHWLMLDNRRMAMVEDGNIRNYRPLFVMDEQELKRYADPRLLVSLPDRSGVAPLAVQPALIATSN